MFFYPYFTIQCIEICLQTRKGLLVNEEKSQLILKIVRRFLTIAVRRLSRKRIHGFIPLVTAIKMFKRILLNRHHFYG